MHANDSDDERIDMPSITWNRKERYAIIAFLLLSVEKKMGSEEKAKLDAFMGIAEAEAEEDADEEESKFYKLKASRDAIIKEGKKFLKSVPHDENLCDCVIDELDFVIDGDDGCSIGDGYFTNSKNGKRVMLNGTAARFFEYLNMVNSDGQYSGNHRRLLQHLARKWDIDKSVLPSLESSAKTLNEIKLKRLEIQESDMPYRKAAAAIAELDDRENAAWDGLEKHGIGKNASSATYTETAALGLSLLSNFTDWPESEDEILDDIENDEKPKLVDKIGDGIVEGIFKIGDIICAPLDWLSGIR